MTEKLVSDDEVRAAKVLVDKVSEFAGHINAKSAGLNASTARTTTSPRPSYSRPDQSVRSAIWISC